MRCLFLRIKQKSNTRLSLWVLLRYGVVRTVLQSNLRSAITTQVVTFMNVGGDFKLASTEILHLSKKVAYMFNQNCRTIIYIVIYIAHDKHAMLKMLLMLQLNANVTKIFLVH